MATTTTATTTKLWGGGKSPFNVEYGKLMMWYFLMSDAFTFGAFLISYGTIARLVRERLRALNVKVVVFDPYLTPELARAEDVARIAGVSLRTLHRHFERYVGVGPKWIIRRARVHEAAERVAHGEAVDWAGLSIDLGYHDQAHLIHDFKEQIGETPAAYAEACRTTPRLARAAV